MTFLIAGFSTAKAQSSPIEFLKFSGFSQREILLLKNDLQYLGQIQTAAGTPNLSRRFIYVGDKIDGAQLLTLLLSKIKTIASNNSCPKSSDGCSRYGDDTIYINVAAHSSDNDFSRIIRLSIIIHEFFHLVDPTDHVNYPGLGAGDEHIFSAHGFTTIVMLNIAKFCSNCSQDFRGEAAWAAWHYHHYLPDYEWFFELTMREDCPQGFKTLPNPNPNIASNDDLFPICNKQ
ncbi:MAG: hypothetical protein PHY93_19415, partial [Bacteriovorax sp.]|nr:hypothetical protein [Bacteriovorax sp.]